jgi:hypothetical protein
MRPIAHQDYVCTCDEPDIDAHVCDSCHFLKAQEWAAYFGIRPGMTSQQRRNQLEAMRPLGCDGKTGAEADT